MKKTAVDWLKDMLEWNYGDPKMLEISWVNLDDLFERAKALEKYQISMAHLEGAMKMHHKEYESGDKYYKETYEEL
jgi:hypothetical protein